MMSILSFLTKSKLKAIVLMALIVCFSLSFQAQMITTYAGNGQYGVTNTGSITATTQFLWMDAIEFDPSGNLYVCTSENKVFKITPAGIISLFAGTGGFTNSGDGGLATSASIGRVRKIAFDAAGNAYIAPSQNHVIRKINTSGIISTVVGNGSGGFSGDGGLATAAITAFPSGLAVDGPGNIYFSEGYTTCGGCPGGIGSDYTRIRKIDASTGIITTIAGTGVSGNTGDGGLALNAKIYPYALATDGSVLYLNGYTGVRKINLSTGIITNYAGNGTNGYSGDGGPALLAQFGSQIFDLKLDAAGNLYLNDWSSVSVVRKISTTGIVTTVAGTGTPGFSGDGGSPVFAKLNLPHAMAIAASGNEFYIADEQNNRIRKVDNLATPVCPNTLSVSKTRIANGSAYITPAISPMSGTPLYSGYFNGSWMTNPLSTVNYSTSTSYTQTFPGNGIYNFTVNYDDTISGFHCVRNLADTIMITNSSTPVSFERRFRVSTNYVCNTGNVSYSDSTYLLYNVNNTPATYTITTNWGNGVTVTNTVNATSQIIYTSAPITYTNPGVYTIQSILQGVGIANDTAYKFVYVDVCGNVMGNIYHDVNSDCGQGWNEMGIPNILVKLNGTTNSYMTWANSGGAYAFNNVSAGTYTISVNGSTAGYTATCSSSLPHLTTVSSTLTAYNDFPMNCSAGFDIASTGISLMNGLFPGQTDKILPHVGILNGTCNFVVPGKVKMILSPCLQYVPGGSFTNPPNSIVTASTGDTLIWNVADINNIGSFGYWNYAVSVTTCTNAVVGDSACITMMVLPTAGDVNPANNIFTRCFQIGVSYDPNYKEVTPRGTGVQGYIPASTNDLTYTLHFQNTGTATAFNIYLLDTINSNLDISSIEVISSSHAVQPYLLAGRTMKFMFAYIYLPDSTHDEEHSHGYVTYRIKTNPGLSPATQIKNTAYIYFDYNSPVVTNTTLNTIELVTSIQSLDMENGFTVFPNPANDKLFVQVFQNTGSDVVMYDVLGHEVKRFQTAELQSEMNVSDLVSGVYFVKVIQGETTHTQKIIIQK